MLENLINKIIIENTAKEYEDLGKLIMESPVELLDFEVFNKDLKSIVNFNETFVKKRKYAIFYNLKTIVIGKKTYKLPSLDKVLEFYKKTHSTETIALLFSEAFDQIIIYYIGKKHE